jgi:hypothetical protein
MISILLLYPLLAGQVVFFISAIILFKEYKGVIPIHKIILHWILSHLLGWFTLPYMILKNKK